MMEKLKRKLKSRAGETIGETLIATLIAALALVMLAAAMSASSGVIVRSRDKLDDYYSLNEEDSGVIRMTSGGTDATDAVTITDASGEMSDASCSVTYYTNTEFSRTPVVSYELKE